MDPSSFTPKQLLALPVTYDVIVGDFGRDATIEYLRLVAQKEKLHIQSILAATNLEFFDEYRRNMVTTISDVAFFKHPLIEACALANGHLTRDVLIGVGTTDISHDFVDRVAASVLQELSAAIERGHDHLRVAVPCNGLSELADRIGQIVGSVSEIRRLRSVFRLGNLSSDAVASAQIAVRTVPAAVIKRLSRARHDDNEARILLLGARKIRSIYQQHVQPGKIELLAVDAREQSLIDQAIVASIAGDSDVIEQYRKILNEELIEPRTRSIGEFIVVEACTDFRFGLGLSSLELFAHDMVAECYGLESA